MKKIISFFLTFILISSLFCVSLNCEAPMKISIEGAKGQVGDKVIVTIKAEEHPTMAASKLKMKYDKNLVSVVDVQAGSVIENTYFELNKNNPGSVFITFLSIEPIKKEGIIATITFEILSDSSVSIPLTLDECDLIDKDNNEITYEAKPGSILVNVLKGDANKDGIADNKDLQYVMNYILHKNDYAKNFDLNEDNVCDITEIVMLNEIIYLSK